MKSTTGKERRFMKRHYGLVQHDGVSETFICRDCGSEGNATDPVGRRLTDWPRDEHGTCICPMCGSDDTGWMFQE
jgi:hypothetical protein